MNLHPVASVTLLQVHFYLRSSTWETRIAAGQAIEAVAKQVPHWAPVKKIKEGIGQRSALRFPPAVHCALQNGLNIVVSIFST